MSQLTLAQIQHTYESAFFEQIGREAAKHAASTNPNERLRAKAILSFADILAGLISNKEGRSLHSALVMATKEEPLPSKYAAEIRVEERAAPVRKLREFDGT